MEEKLNELKDLITDHLDDHAKTREEEKERYERILTLSEQNAKNIAQVIEETRGVVQLHSDLVTVIKVGSAVQRFGVWVTKWPLIALGFYTMINWILEHFGKATS